MSGLREDGTEEGTVAWNVQALFSTALFLKIGHSANAVSAVGGNVKKFNFKRVSSSSSPCNDTDAESGSNYKSTENQGRRKFVSMAPLSPSPPSPLLTLLFLLVCTHSVNQSHPYPTQTDYPRD